MNDMYEEEFNTHLDMVHKIGSREGAVVEDAYDSLRWCAAYRAYKIVPNPLIVNEHLITTSPSMVLAYFESQLEDAVKYIGTEKDTTLPITLYAMAVLEGEFEYDTQAALADMVMTAIVSDANEDYDIFKKKMQYSNIQLNRQH